MRGSRSRMSALRASIRATMHDLNHREDNMLKHFAIAGALALMTTAASAQTLEKKNFNYSEWTKGRFSEAVTVAGPGKIIFLAGVGAEDENGKGGDILHKGDFMAQCRYSFDKIKRALAKNGATLGDV